MFDTATTTSTDSWSGTGWIISPGYGVNVVDVPPPQTADDRVAEPFPLEVLLADGLQVLGVDEYLELAEDLVVAQEAVEEYEANGIDGSVAYSEYRAQRVWPIRLIMKSGCLHVLNET